MAFTSNAQAIKCLNGHSFTLTNRKIVVLPGTSLQIQLRARNPRGSRRAEAVVVMAQNCTSKPCRACFINYGKGTSWIYESPMYGKIKFQVEGATYQGTGGNESFTVTSSVCMTVLCLPSVCSSFDI